MQLQVAGITKTQSFFVLITVVNLHSKPLWKYDLTKCTSQQPSFEAIGQNEAERGI